MSETAQELRGYVLDALVGFMCKNQPMTEITQLGYIPTEMELAEFPALRLSLSEDSPPRVFLHNIAVPQ